MTMRTIARIAAIAFMLVMLVSVAAPVNGWTFQSGGTTNGKAWTQGDIKWCIANNGGWTTWHFNNTLNAAFEHWDSAATRKTLTNNCYQPNIRVHVVSFSAKGWAGNPARTFTNMGVFITGADIYFNKDSTSQFYFSTAGRACYVPCSPRLDFWTVALHEIGHSLGLGENAGAARNLLCVGGYLSENTALACLQDYYSVDVMYWNAGEGYRRWIESDSLNGLYALGYR